MQDARRPETTRRITQGVITLLTTLDAAPLTELRFTDGRRADVTALLPDGTLWIVEVKSCFEDWRADEKWKGYRAWCDRFFFAVEDDFPTECLPEDAGLIIADGFGGAIVREAPLVKLAPARRKALTLRFARTAALRFSAPTSSEDQA